MEKLGSCPRIVLIKSADRAPNSYDLKDLLQPQPSVELFFKGNKNRLPTNPRLFHHPSPPKLKKCNKIT